MPIQDSSKRTYLRCVDFKQMDGLLWRIWIYRQFVLNDMLLRKIKQPLKKV